MADADEALVADWLVVLVAEADARVVVVVVECSAVVVDVVEEAAVVGGVVGLVVGGLVDAHWAYSVALDVNGYTAWLA